MERRRNRVGRVLTCLGLLSTTAYLGWRIATLPSGPPLWLVVLAIVVEVGGLVGSALLAWALWHAPPSAVAIGPANGERRRVDVVVRVDRQPIHDIRATLLSLDAMGDRRRIVVDLHARPEIAALAGEFGVVYAATDVDDRNGLKTCGAAVMTPLFLLLDAGDVPAANAVEALLPWMDDDSVAVVSGQSLMADDDSAEHGPNGIHELNFDRWAMNPALGGRGAAILCESGALVRRAALESIEPGDEEPVEAQAHWSVALMTAGWKLTAARGPAVVVRPVVQSQDAVYEQRVLRARAARATVFGHGGAARWGTLRLGQRLAVAAAAVRPLSGLRRGAFVSVVVGSLLTGCLPFQPDARVLAATWAPGWLLTSLGLWLLSGGALRPGDRTRWSLRNLGASFQGLRHPLAFDHRRDPIMTPHALQHGGALVASVVVLSAVMMLRGISERWTHALGSMRHTWLVGLIAVALWLLAMSLDVLRMFGKRNQLRRATRVVASIPAEVDDNPVSVFDVTALGAGFETNQEVIAKQPLLLQAVITTNRGCQNVTLPIVVRNVRAVSEERWRVGAEFSDPTSAAINPLVEYCMVEPARDRLRRGGADASPPTIVPAEDDFTSKPIMDGRRVALRLISLAAVGGAIASAQPGNASVTTSLVSAASVLIAAGVLAGSVRPRRAPWMIDQSTSSPSPDLAIR